MKTKYLKLYSGRSLLCRNVISSEAKNITAQKGTPKKALLKGVQIKGIGFTNWCNLLLQQLFLRC